MDPAEVGALADLWVASWHENRPAVDFAARWTWISAVLVDPAHIVLVADREGAAEGFAVLRREVLQQLVVAPSAKGTHAATALLAAAKTRHPAELRLEVEQANGRALRFYRREGFRHAGEGRDTVSGHPTWHMRWP